MRLKEREEHKIFYRQKTKKHKIYILRGSVYNFKCSNDCKLKFVPNKIFLIAFRHILEKEQGIILAKNPLFCMDLK